MRVILALMIALTLAACTTNSAPDISATTNGANSPVNINTGNGGAAGSAPCAATGTQNKGSINNGGSNGSASDCSTTTTTTTGGAAEQKIGGMKSLTGIDMADIR